MQRLDRARPAIPAILGAIALASLAALFAWDAFPGPFPPGAHDLLGALPLALIAFAWLGHQVVRRAAPLELVKAAMLAAAFLFWAANQAWPGAPVATLCNDIAIALFVLDVFLVIVGRPANTPKASLAATSTSRNGANTPSADPWRR